MSITLKTPVTFTNGSDTTLSAATSRLDLLSGLVQGTHTYGNGVDASFVPDSTAPGVNVTFSLSSGSLYVNGIPFQVAGKNVSIASADLTAIVTAFTTAQNAVDQAFINAGVFAGTVG